MRVVLDTNIIVGAMLSGGGATREILRLSLENCITPLIGVALFTEMQDVLSRSNLFQYCLLDAAERDEADNHIVDLAVAGDATYMVTQNERDFQKMKLLFPDLEIINTADFLAIWRAL